MKSEEQRSRADGPSSEAEDRRVVVGVDGSAQSLAALRAAARAAEQLGGSLVVVTTWGGPAVYYGTYADTPEEEIQLATDSQATALAEAFGSEAPVPVRTVVCVGPAARVLVEQSEGADLLVVGSRGRGGFAGLLLGSVSMACAQHAACPVLIMHGPR